MKKNKNIMFKIVNCFMVNSINLFTLSFYFLLFMNNQRNSVLNFLFYGKHILQFEKIGKVFTTKLRSSNETK